MTLQQSHLVFVSQTSHILSRFPTDGVARIFSVYFLTHLNIILTYLGPTNSYHPMKEKTFEKELEF